MKLWTTVDLVSVPFIFQEGLTNPSHAEIIFRVDPEILAEDVLEMRADEGPDYLPAFFEVDFPDDQLNNWFSVCVDSNFEEIEMDKTALADNWEGGELTQEEYDEEALRIQTAEEAFEKDDIPTILALHGFACLYTVVPPEMLKLLDPATMLEAVLTGDQTAILEAVQTADVRGLESMGASFWVWLIMFMAGLFGPNWSDKIEAEEAAKQAEGRRARRRKPRRKGKVARKRKKAKKKKTMAGVVS